MPAQLTDLYVVTHTHWDREWYHTAERFHQRLARLVDELLDDPPPAGESFLLDGQAIVLEDYLAIRPERAAELATLLRDGRLEAGPWYVLADELIPSGEALVRNLLTGRDVVRRLRAEPPPVLYCPDSFGHPAVLPDIAAGFGCDVIVLWRGFAGRSDVARWRGPSGHTALIYHLPPDGYEFGSSLPVDRELSAQRWERIESVLAPRAAAGVSLLFNGADHHARQRNLGAALNALQSAASPVRVHATSLGAAARALLDASTDARIPETVGELRDSYGYTWTLQGTLATRAAQKRRNAMAERCLVRDVEPWIALGASGGDAPARALLNAAWRTLLQSHPHDTLCGTSIDAVADAFDARMASVDAQSRGLRDDALLDLTGHNRDRARESADAWRPAVLVRNPVARSRAGVVELTLSATIADVAVGPGSAQRQGARRPATKWGVSGVPLQVLGTRETIALTESPRAYPDADLVAEARAVGWVGAIGGYGVETRLHGARARGFVPHRVVATGRALENGRVRITVDASGEITFEDRELGRQITNAVSLERARDAGDLYTPAIREAIPIGPARRIRVVHRGPIRGEIVIEYAVRAEKALPAGFCRLHIQLDADSRALRVEVRGDNRSHDHRLRLRIATGLTNATTIADAAFLPVARVARSVAPAIDSMEHVVPTAPLHRWVARFTNDAGFALVSDGLAEYESTNDGEIFVTLLRAVGELSRTDLPERPGHAGWPASTPGAQSIGHYEARFALQLVGADSPDVRDKIEQFADDVLLPISGETLRSNLLPLTRAAGLALSGAGLMFSAAMPARRDGWIVLRCVNHRATSVHGAWHVGREITEAVRARLDETPLEALTVAANVVRFTAEPFAIFTILVR
ncbi:MAG: glycoside hydrolase family 38 C-terminal domain-containing protein [bacterium]